MLRVQIGPRADEPPMKRPVLPTLLVLAAGLVVFAVGLPGCEAEPPPPAKPVCADGLDVDHDGRCDRETADWSVQAELPAAGHRGDVYHLGKALPTVASAGLRHIHAWPVTVSGVLLPWGPLSVLFSPDATDKTTLTAQGLARNALGFGTIPEMFAWLGLHPRGPDPQAFAGVPWPAEIEPDAQLGAGLVQTKLGQALTFSCATCHTARVFGKTVVGLTNRQSRANAFFGLGKQFFPLVTPELAVELGKASTPDLAQLEQAQKNLPAIGYKEPAALGLDTSLAQVALSLSLRKADAWASRDAAVEAEPRPNLLDTLVADSKPAVWWSLKYKTRWLSDGSIVSGNPIFTNVLWNELGRGTDLHALADWMQANRRVVDELTALVFAVPAPRWSEVFPHLPIDQAAAQRGQKVFAQTCAGCHGTYQKGWEVPGSPDPLRTTAVHYPKRTPVLDVGTDPQRAQGMAGFADALNALEISKRMGTVIEVQTGYVPPPLEGIFLRYPYLHNQSVPTLCDLLRPAKERPPVFWLGPDQDPATDFDSACVGLPVAAAPDAWKTDPRAKMDTALPGLSNRGHDAWLVEANGQPKLSAAQRADLVEFLKTL